MNDDKCHDTNTVKLRDHLEKRMHEMEKRFEIKLEAMEQALKVTGRDVDRRLSELNQLRQEVTTDRIQFVQREPYQVWRELVEKRLTTSETRAVTWTAAIALFFLIISIVLKFVK